MDPDNPFHACAIAVGGIIAEEFESVQAVYLRGSALESSIYEKVSDIDLVVVFRREENRSASRSAVRNAVHRVWPPHDVFPPPDLAFADRSNLRSIGPYDQICFILSLRSTLLAGNHCRETWSPPVADLAQALRLWREYVRETDRGLNRLLRNRRHPAARGVPWFQKRVLRLGGIEALARLKRFNRHPMGCAELIAEAVPELGSDAEEVLASFVASDRSESAWRRAASLYSGLRRLSCLEKQVVLPREFC